MTWFEVACWGTALAVLLLAMSLAWKFGEGEINDLP